MIGARSAQSKTFFGSPLWLKIPKLKKLLEILRSFSVLFTKLYAGLSERKTESLWEGGFRV
jgi:hypothetical protein